MDPRELIESPIGAKRLRRKTPHREARIRRKPPLEANFTTWPGAALPNNPPGGISNHQ